MSKLRKIINKVANYLVHVLTDLHILKEEPTWTKESSYALVIAVDYVRETYPEVTTKRMKEILSESAATVDFITQKNATSEVFLNCLKKGLEYKTFFFYESAHGNNQCIRMIDHNVSAREVWNILRNAKNRIVGFFDSCHSGSMIVDPENPTSENATAKDLQYEGTMADYLVEMFKEQAKTARGNEKQPQIRLYSACANGVISTYEPTIGTRFADALIMSWKMTPGKTYTDFDKLLIEKGSYGNSPKIDPKYRVTPQISTFGEDFSNYERLR